MSLLKREDCRCHDLIADNLSEDELLALEQRCAQRSGDWEISHQPSSSPSYSPPRLMCYAHCYASSNVQIRWFLGYFVGCFPEDQLLKCAIFRELNAGCFRHNSDVSFPMLQDLGLSHCRQRPVPPHVCCFHCMCGCSADQELFGLLTHPLCSTPAGSHLQAAADEAKERHRRVQDSLSGAVAAPILVGWSLVVSMSILTVHPSQPDCRLMQVISVAQSMAVRPANVIALNPSRWAKMSGSAAGSATPLHVGGAGKPS